MSRGTTQTPTAATGNKSRLIVSITTSMRDIEPEGWEEGVKHVLLTGSIDRFGFSNAPDAWNWKAEEKRRRAESTVFSKNSFGGFIGSEADGERTDRK